MTKGIGLLALCLAITGLGAPRCEAVEWEDVRAKVLAVGTGSVIVVDKTLHWSWEVLHNKLVHPLVHVVTFGAVNLDHPES